MICLGCGRPITGDCERCYVKLRDTVATSHWPLETSLSPAALEEVEEAVGRHLSDFELSGYFDERPQLHTELSNLVAIIRAHLQHLSRAPKAAIEKDPLLL